jgi:hypothetical protein
MEIIIIKNLEVINVFKIMLVDKDYVIDISITHQKKKMVDFGPIVMHFSFI